MNKKVVLLLAICMLVSVFPVGIAAAEDTPLLVFDMEIQDGGTAGESIANTESAGRTAGTSLVKASAETDKYIEKVDGISPDFFVGGYEERFDTPALYGKEAGANGEELKYLSFATSRPKTEEETSKYDYVTVRGNSRLVVPLDKTLDIADKDLVFEAWIRPNKDLNDTRANSSGAITNHHDYNDVFKIGSARGAFGSTTGKLVTGFRWSVRSGDSFGPRFYYQTGTTNPYYSFYNTTTEGQSAIGYMPGYNQKWMHLVITRKWNAETDATGKWSSRIYIDGVFRGTKSSDIVTRMFSPSSTASETDPRNHLVIGGSETSSNFEANPDDEGYAFKGDIAEFRLYIDENGIEAKKLDEFIEDKYLATKKPYLEAVTPAFTDSSFVAEPDADSISFKFSGEVPKALITNDNIKVQTADGGYTLNTGTISYDESSYQVTIPIKDYMEYGAEYKVWLSKDIKDKYDNWLSSYNLPFSTKTFFEGVSLEDTAKIEGYNGSVENSSEISIKTKVAADGGDYTLALIVFKNGILYKVITDSEADGGNNLAVSTYGIDLASGDEYVIKAIAWKYDEIQGAVSVSGQIVLD